MTDFWPSPEEEARATEKAAAVLAARIQEGMRIAIAWNAKHPIGTPVFFWPGMRAGDGLPSKTRTEAWVLASGVPVVSVMGAASVALTHVEPVTVEAAR